MKYELEEEIIHFIFLAFYGKKRKKENIDMVFHSVMVANMLKNMNCDQNTIYIGYLHDIIEDTIYDYDLLKNKYGEKIADGVELLSENNNIISYIERKKDFLNKIQKIPDNLLMVELADKLQNLISDYDQYKIYGKNFLVTEASNYEKLKWFYLELKKLFNERLKNNILLERYNEITKEYFEEL